LPAYGDEDRAGRADGTLVVARWVPTVAVPASLELARAAALAWVVADVCPASARRTAALMV
jgi:hypothetical protein